MPICTERMVLLKTYQDAMHVYAAAVANMTLLIGNDLPALQSEQIQTTVEQARIEARRAKAAFEEHIAKDLCTEEAASNS